MELAIAANHAGFPLKKEVRGYFESLGHQVLDLDAFLIEPSNYADYGDAVGRALIVRRAELYA